MWPCRVAERRLVEDLADQAEVLVDDERTAVADRDAGGLLAAVLQRVEAEVGELGDLLAGRPDAEDAAGVLRARVVGDEFVGQLAVAARHASECTGAAGRSPRRRTRSGARVSPASGARHPARLAAQLRTGRYGVRSARLPLARTAPAATASAKRAGRWPAAARSAGRSRRRSAACRGCAAARRSPARRRTAAPAPRPSARAPARRGSRPGRGRRWPGPRGRSGTGRTVGQRAGQVVAVHDQLDAAGCATQSSAVIGPRPPAPRRVGDAVGRRGGAGRGVAQRGDQLGGRAVAGRRACVRSRDLRRRPAGSARTYSAGRHGASRRAGRAARGGQPVVDERRRGRRGCARPSRAGRTARRTRRRAGRSSQSASSALCATNARSSAPSRLAASGFDSKRPAACAVHAGAARAAGSGTGRAPPASATSRSTTPMRRDGRPCAGTAR